MLLSALFLPLLYTFIAWRLSGPPSDVPLPQWFVEGGARVCTEWHGFGGGPGSFRAMHRKSPAPERHVYNNTPVRYRRRRMRVGVQLSKSRRRVTGGPETGGNGLVLYHFFRVCHNDCPTGGAPSSMLPCWAATTPPAGREGCYKILSVSALSCQSDKEG